MHAVVVTGFVRHARPLARLLNAYTSDWKATYYSNSTVSHMRAIAHCTVAAASITYGGPGPKPLIRYLCNSRGRPAIVVWAGSDVQAIAAAPYDLELLRLDRLVHWASGPNLLAELRDLGIDARYVPTASAIVPNTPAAMPRTFTVLSYLPKPRRSFYGQAFVWEAARALPDALFLAVGHGDAEPGAPPNVHYLGEVSDMESRIDASTVLLRVPDHDNSVCQGVIEALARGRYVVWTHPCPGAIAVPHRSDAVAALKGLHDAHLAGVLSLNTAGIQHVLRNYDPGAVAIGIERALHEAIAASNLAASGNNGKPKVFISGSNAQASRAAAICRTQGSLDASVATSRSLSDTVVSILDLLHSDVWYAIGDPAPAAAFEIAASFMRKRRVLHWRVDDVHRVERDPKRCRRLHNRRYVHLAADADAARRLASIGLPSRVVPVEQCTELLRAVCDKHSQHTPDDTVCSALQNDEILGLRE